MEQHTLAVVVADCMPLELVQVMAALAAEVLEVCLVQTVLLVQQTLEAVAEDQETTTQAAQADQAL